MRPANPIISIIKPLCFAINLHKVSAVNEIPSKGKIHPEIVKKG
jgi:hypothetical protein